jgi:hypothetical protein
MGIVAKNASPTSATGMEQVDSVREFTITNKYKPSGRRRFRSRSSACWSRRFACYGNAVDLANQLTRKEILIKKDSESTHQILLSREIEETLREEDGINLQAVHFQEEGLDGISFY